MEKIIFETLLIDEKFVGKVFPFLKSEYFEKESDKVIFDLIANYQVRYSVMPTKESLMVDLSERRDIKESTFKESYEAIRSFEEKTDNNLDWLVDKTEKFCKDRAIYNALMKSVAITHDDTGTADKGSIPHLLSSALAVTFDTSVGLSYDDSIDALWEYYNSEVAIIPTGLSIIDKVTRGGLRKKTLSIIMATTGGGKTILMCHIAANTMMEGKNVLYISMEMSEEMITQRIDANLMNIPMDEIETMPYEQYASRKKAVLSRARGRLVVKSYPTGSASANNFRALLSELEIKQGFKPDLVCIDYLNICASSRLKAAESGSHQYPKAVAEEARSLAIEFDYACLSATQSNRQGYGTTDPDLTHTSESMGLPMTADLFFSLSTSDELEALGQVSMTQLKNRFGDINRPRRFVLGLDRPKMRFYDVEDYAQDGIHQGAGQINPSSSMGGSKSSSMGGSKFSGFS